MISRFCSKINLGLLMERQGPLKQQQQKTTEPLHLHRHTLCIHRYSAFGSVALQTRAVPFWLFFGSLLDGKLQRNGFCGRKGIPKTHLLGFHLATSPWGFGGPVDLHLQPLEELALQGCLSSHSSLSTQMEVCCHVLEMSPIT